MASLLESKRLAMCIYHTGNPYGSTSIFSKQQTQVRQFERYIEVTSIVKSCVFNGLYDIEVLVHEIFVITHLDHKAIDTR